MKKLTAILVFSLIAFTSFSQKNENDSTAVKRTADSIRNNEPLLSKTDVYDLISRSITGYRNARGESVKSRFTDAILKDDLFNGEECNAIIDHAIRIIAGDLNRLINEAEAKKKRRGK